MVLIKRNQLGLVCPGCKRTLMPKHKTYKVAHSQYACTFHCKECRMFYRMNITVDKWADRKEDWSFG